MKIYVVEKKVKNRDGELLTKVETYKSKPMKFNYIVWI